MNHPLMRTTIRTRILSIFIAVTLIQALLMGVFFLHQNHQARDTHVKLQLQGVTKKTKSQLALFLNRNLHGLELISQQIEHIAPKEYQRHDLLATLTDSNSAFSSIVFYDSDGIIRNQVSNNTIEKIPPPPCLTQNPALFQTPSNSGKPYLTQLTIEDGTFPVLAICQPVKFLNNSSVAGVLSALLPYDQLQQFLRKSILPPDISVLVLSQEGKILTQTPQSVSSRTSFPSDQQWNGTVVIDNTSYISAMSSLDFHGELFHIVAKIEALKSGSSQTPSFLLLGFFILLLLLLSTLVGWTTNKKIIEPLQLLANESTTLLQGKNIIISPPADTEFQKLANVMNTLNLRLQEANSSLEEEVKRRRNEEKSAIQAKVNAEKANQAKSIFLANMSHEIRSPLHALLAIFDMFEKGSLSTEQKQLLSMAKVSGQQLQTVVDSILDLSHIESGKFHLHHAPFSLSQVITEVLELMRIQTNDKDILITSTLESDIPDKLIGDGGRIRQILINLISNSIKFSKQGTIELNVALQSTPSETEVELLFTVRDSGIGVSDTARKTIFDAFNRGDIEKEQIIDGIGLGLAISAEFVEHMRGRLWLGESNEKGSTFHFTIFCDIDRKEEPEIQAKNILTIPLKKLLGIQVFLAEDEFINQRLISAYLEEQGCDVTVCENGQELIDLMEKKHADIILMDIRMPVLNGLDATKIIRQKEKETGKFSVPIIALTAQATTDFEQKCNLAGMNGYLTKPIPLKQLIAIIDKLVAR